MLEPNRARRGVEFAAERHNGHGTAYADDNDHAKAHLDRIQPIKNSHHGVGEGAGEVEAEVEVAGA